MKRINAIVTFIFFLEEFLFWQPLRINTLFEKIGKMFLTSIQGNEVNFNIIVHLNPAIAWFLLLISVGPIVNEIKSTFSEKVRADILIWLERNKYIHAILAVLLGIILLFSLLNIFDDPYLTISTVYQNKTFWGIIFFYMISKRFLSERNW